MKHKGTVLVVDDEADFREDVVEITEAAGFRVLAEATGEAGLQLAQRHTVDVALLDLVMPGMNGIELMKEMKLIDALTQVVILTGQSSIESAVEAMREGALDYLSKPARLDELEAVVDRAWQTGRLARQNRAYQAVQSRMQQRTAMKVIARSEAMQKIIKEAEGLAKMEMTVLIQGETGTGKEVVAQLIHANSVRSKMPLTVLNCAAMPENLLDAELFGHEKGTYTGATEARPGMIEVSDGGTLLLDEIGDMPQDAQARLLRFLENGTFRRLGGRVEKAVDVRVIAATNRNLKDAIQKGRFREDLYHRLRVYEMELPPLRQRTADILPLVESALNERSGLKETPISLSSSACDAFHAYSWPGNVRELLHTVERAAFAAAMSNATEIRPEHLNLPGAENHSMDLDSVLKAAQQAHVSKVLTLTGGNRKKAAEILSVSERQMYRLVGDLTECDESRTGPHQWKR